MQHYDWKCSRSFSWNYFYIIFHKRTPFSTIIQLEFGCFFCIFCICMKLIFINPRIYSCLILFSVWFRSFWNWAVKHTSRPILKKNTKKILHIQPCANCRCYVTCSCTLVDDPCWCVVSSGSLEKVFEVWLPEQWAFAESACDRWMRHHELESSLLPHLCR